MKKTLLVLAVLLLLILSLLPIPPKDADGAFNVISGAIWCQNGKACLHEIGHKLDKDSGWISGSEDFKLTISTYIAFEAYQGTPSETALRLIAYPLVYDFNPFRITHAEIYASLFSWSGGKQENMPDLFRKFYDWDRAAKLIEKYASS